ncbi:MAG: efflux system, outer rane lipoprotein NodT family [Caulobacter sp.]|nr:efflux system, outer rane lipoprotein NodT family [Caulobacter sp.]
MPFSQVAHATRPGLLLLATASTMAINACASFPSEQAARVATPPGAYASAQTLAGPQADWPADEWWKGYGDAQLNTLMAEALAGSPTIAIAEARLRAADAVADQARGAALPNVTADGSVREQKQSYNDGIPPAFVPQGYNPAGRLALNFSWELDFWGRNRAAIAAATSEAQAVAAEGAEARLMLSTNVAAAYAELSRLYAQRDVAERTLTAQQETAGLVRRRVEAGLDTRGEQAAADAGPLSAKVALSSIDEQIALTRNSLAALMGQGPDRGLAIQRPQSTTLKPFGLPANLAADLIGRRPDIVAARWRAQASASRVKGARAAFYPNINLAALVGVEALPIGKLFSSGSDIGQFGPAFSLPIFEGGQLRAGLKGAEARRDESVAVYDSQVIQALREVADVVASERALAPRLADARAALAADEEAYRIARLRYEGKLANYQSVLLAEQVVLAQRRVNADLESRGLALDIALIRALGGGFHSG